VPHDHPDSIYRLVHESFLSRVPIPVDNIHPIPTEGLSSSEAAVAYYAPPKPFYVCAALQSGFSADLVAASKRLTIAERLYSADSIAGIGDLAGYTYGIVGDPGGDIAWLGGYFTGTGAYKANFANNTCTFIPTGSQVTAMTMDLAGNIWACGYNTNTVHKISPAGVILQSKGTTVWPLLDLPAGHYAAICFVGDPNHGGEPHAMEGMIAVFDVK